MNEEIKFYSIGRGNLNIDGKFYYGLDYAITDFMRNLEQENQKSKDNWNKLKEWLEEEITNDTCCTDLITHCLSIQDLVDEKQYILEKLQEIEGGMNE